MLSNIFSACSAWKLTPSTEQQCSKVSLLRKPNFDLCSISYVGVWILEKQSCAQITQTALPFEKARQLAPLREVWTNLHGRFYSRSVCKRQSDETLSTCIPRGMESVYWHFFARAWMWMKSSWIGVTLKMILKIPITIPHCTIATILLHFVQFWASQSAECFDISSKWIHPGTWNKYMFNWLWAR